MTKEGELFSCWYCGSPNLAGEKTVVVCDVCNKVSSREHGLPWRSSEERQTVDVALLAEPPRRELRPSGALLRPRTVAIERDGGTLRLKFRAGRRHDLNRLWAASMISLFLLYILVHTLRGDLGYEADPAVTVMILLVLAAVSVPALNRQFAPVVLTAHSSGLEVRSKLFGISQRRIDRSDLSQLYCVSRTIPATSDHDAEERFHLIALLQDKTTIELAELGEADSALYLERELEHALGIVDKATHRNS